MNEQDNTATQHEETVARPDSSQTAQRDTSAYPPGFEPELEGEELQRAITKEKRYRMLVWFQLLFLLAIVILIIYFIVTS